MKIRVHEIRIGPEDPLRRSGLTLESSSWWADSGAWQDTLLWRAGQEGVPGGALELLEEHGANFFAVLKKMVEPNGVVHGHPILVEELPYPQDAVLERLVELGVVMERAPKQYVHSNSRATFGATFEALVLHGLHKIGLDACREAKVIYPKESGGSSYDPDGQKYDILAGIDLTSLLWIECKKPLYLPQSQNPLQRVLSVEAVRRFYTRAWQLRPEIAVYLVDTYTDYYSILEQHFQPGATLVERQPEELSDIVARLNGFIYFCRVDYDEKPARYFSSLKRSIQQVLYAARVRPSVARDEVGDIIA